METSLPSQPRRPRNADTHQAIITAAVRILKQEGLAKFTIERIAQLSGAGKPTIYRWWPNKTALLIEVFNTETNSYVTIPDLNSTHKELHAWFKGVWNMWQTSASGPAFRAILAQIQSDQTAMAFFNESFVPHRRKLLFDILERAQNRGELAGRDLDVIIDYCWGFNWYHLLTGTVPADAEILEVIETVTRS